MAHVAVGLAAGTGDDDLVPAPGVGNRLKITEIYLDADGNTDVHLKSGASGTFHIGNATQGVSLITIGAFRFARSFLCDENAPLTLNRETSVPIAGVIGFEIVKVSDAG